MQNFEYFDVHLKTIEMKEEYFCKYDKSYVACFYETDVEHRDLLQREHFLPSERLSVSNKFFAPRRYNSNKSTNYMQIFLKFIT
jgi:hypothetical protein